MSKIEAIRFTKSSAPFGWMGNMSRYKIVFEEQEWKSTEALFQALRFPEDSPIREEIRLAKNGYEAKQVAKANRTKMSVVPTSEEDLDNMRLCIALKIEQHSELRDVLIGSVGIPIYEDVTFRGEGGSNTIWGAIKQEDGSWKGDNVMGELWMELRAQLTGETTEVETERRFLLKRVPHIQFDDAIMIKQHYLSEKKAKIVERVICSQRDADSEPYFRYTSKERISELSVNETERDLTGEEYDELVKTSKRSLRKTRWVKNEGDLKWEIDEMKSFTLVVAEVEIPSEDFDLEIPQYIKDNLIMEITGCSEFSNSNLSE